MLKDKGIDLNFMKNIWMNKDQQEVTKYQIFSLI